MGMFDSLYIDCPNCKAEGVLEFQSKNGPCECNIYNIENVPDEVLIGLHQDIDAKCPYCGKSFLPKVREQKVVVIHTIVLVEVK